MEVESSDLTDNSLFEVTEGKGLRPSGLLLIPSSVSHRLVSTLTCVKVRSVGALSDFSLSVFHSALPLPIRLQLSHVKGLPRFLPLSCDHSASCQSDLCLSFCSHSQDLFLQPLNSESSSIRFIEQEGDGFWSQ